MLDPALVRDRLDAIREGFRNRGLDADRELEQLATLEARRRRVIPELEGLKRQQNAAGDEVAKAKRQGQDTTAMFAAGKQRAVQIKQLEIELDQIEQQRTNLLMALPNLPHSSVPIGSGSDGNVEVRRHGDPRTFDFPVKAHWELGPALGILDFERATKMSGTRFSVLTGAGARLARALINFMLELHTGEHGYQEIEPPFLVNAAALAGTGNLPKFEADLFKIGGDWDLYLIPTAEVPLTNLHRGEIIDGRQLPFVHGLYALLQERGRIIRGRRARAHPTAPVRQGGAREVRDARQSYAELESLTAHAEEVLKRLELPFRTVSLCTGDLGFAAAKTYDIEVWLPSQNTYREISSCSNTEAFQARRANIRFRPGGTGKAEFVHTLNGSGLAVGRTWIAIVENYQQKDGLVAIPAALRPYMNGLEAIQPR